ncbi:putative ATPases of PP-loop superfamily [Archaeoglobus sulfaticallidus PM70-1]|uniref:Putative ATPases of PP-loop superfamily n=1 Tax=Archaeoglobus sulfaticallidus PM70-1 TaxID=387631 RepID=N0BEW4_9EURY|nr:diphthine--ammonia ligase [Archaeoglobus sulfaticallidus]AGK62189.1 putative ATPases of PP-loop superfamily [Archaeoglobus sulfaticallidus PM70-1]
MIVAMWSGGKDSCLAVHRMLRNGNEVSKLICMLDEDNQSRAHGFYKIALERQLKALQIDGVFGNSSWEGYKSEFKRLMNGLKAEKVVFGDIFLEEHRVWLEQVCDEVNVEPVFPLWKEDTEKLAREFLSEGYTAYIVSVRKDLGLDEYLGRKFSDEIIDELMSLGVDPCGELGEFHTFVTDGPMFVKPVEFEFGNVVEREKYKQIQIL